MNFYIIIALIFSISNKSKSTNNPHKKFPSIKKSPATSTPHPPPSHPPDPSPSPSHPIPHITLPNIYIHIKIYQLIKIKIIQKFKKIVLFVKMQEAPSLLQVLKGHKQSIVALDLHPKCRLVASAGLDSTFLLWDVRDKNQTSRKYEGHKGYIQDLKFHPNGAIIASASADGAIKFWENENETKEVTITKAHNSKVRSIGYSCDGNLLVSGGDDKNVKIWSTLDRRLQAQLKKHENWVRYCQFSPIAKNVASCDDRYVYIWDIATKKVVQQFKQHTGVINQVRFHSLSSIVGSCSYDKKIKLYDLRSNQVIQTYQGHTGSVKSIDFHPHTCHLISSSDDGTIKIWNTVKNRLQYTVDSPSNITKFSREGDYFISAGVQKVINLWKTGFYDSFKEKIDPIGNVGDAAKNKIKWEVKQDGKKQTSESQDHQTSKKDKGQQSTNKREKETDPELLYCHQKQNFEYMNRPPLLQKTQKSLIPLSLQKKLLQMSTQIDFITKTTQILEARVLNNGEQLRRIVEMVQMGNKGEQPLI